jgi:hypothetical protein
MAKVKPPEERLSRLEAEVLDLKRRVADLERDAELRRKEEDGSWDEDEGNGNGNS